MQPLRAYDSEEIAVIDNVGLLDIENSYLFSSEYKRHQQTHLQTHLDEWSSKVSRKSGGNEPGSVQDI